MYTIVNSIDETSWARFVYENPRGNVFQTPEMYKVYEKTKRMEAVKLFAVDGSGDIAASLVAYLSEEKGGILAPFATRSIITGGPLYGENGGIDAITPLMQEYDKITRGKAVFTDIRNHDDTSNLKDLLLRMGYVYKSHLNILVDLNKAAEDIFANFSKSRRRFIRKAEENGVTVEEAKNSRDIETFYQLLSETYRNAKLPLADISLFNSAFEILSPKGMMKLFMVRHKNDYIGGISTLVYGRVITEWYVSGSRAHSKLYPSEMATWYPMKWGSENSCRLFDFGGAGKPDVEYGVRDFKMQFGGRLVEYGRYEKIHSGPKMKAAELGFKIYRKLL
jgi:serine/alanine adding enzyme